MDLENKYMELAIELAKNGEGAVNPNPMVGAIVVKDGEIIGRGYHKKFGGPHAEVYALEEAGILAKGADMYVTLEPCSHHGKTPPCADAIIKAGIRRCIVAMKDPNPLVAGRGLNKMKEAGIEVISGIMEQESQEINKVFVKYINNDIPYIFLKTALTLDGKIATSSGDSKWISNEEARKKVQKYRNKYMGIMVGINTVLKDNPRLTARIENGIDPYRIVIDPELVINIEANIIMNNTDKKTIIVTSQENMRNEKYKKLKEKNVKFIFIPGKEFEIYIVMQEIKKLGIDSVLVEGGSKVISHILREKIVDEGVFFIAPKILGDSNAIPLIEGFDVEKMSEAIKLKDVNYKIYGDNIGIHFSGIEETE